MSTSALQIEAASEVSNADMANAIRALSMDAVEKAKSGHPGMPMGMAGQASKIAPVPLAEMAKSYRFGTLDPELTSVSRAAE